MAQAAIPLAVMAATSVLEGVMEGKALRADARVDEENARRAQLDGALAEDATRRQERALSGEAVAALAANGVALGTGSALDLLQQNAVNREMEVLRVRYASEGEAASLRFQGAQKRAAAKNAVYGGILRAGAKVITGMADSGAASKVSAAQRYNPGGMQLPMQSGGQ